MEKWYFRIFFEVFYRGFRSKKEWGQKTDLQKNAISVNIFNFSAIFSSRIGQILKKDFWTQLGVPYSGSPGNPYKFGPIPFFEEKKESPS